MELNEISEIEPDTEGIVVGRRIKLAIDGYQLELHQTRSPSLDRRLRETGTAYVVSLAGAAKLAKFVRL
jgi:hypothetical protein